MVIASELNQSLTQSPSLPYFSSYSICYIHMLTAFSKQKNHTAKCVHYDGNLCSFEHSSLLWPVNIIMDEYFHSNTELLLLQQDKPLAHWPWV